MVWHAPFDADGLGTSDLDVTLIGAGAMELFKPTAFFVPGVNSRPLSGEEKTATQWGGPRDLARIGLRCHSRPDSRLAALRMEADETQHRAHSDHTCRQHRPAP
jgi:hypothetical protein